MQVYQSNCVRSSYNPMSRLSTDMNIVLAPNDRITGVYSKPFSLAYVVTLAEHQLSTDLHVHNTSASEAFEFQALLHTYIRAPADEVQVTPLKGLSYYDKTESTEPARITSKTESREEVDVKKITDSVYENGPLKYKVTWPSGGLEVRAKNLKDVVIWNPQADGAKIGDMEADGWWVLCIFICGHYSSFSLRHIQEEVCVRGTWLCQGICHVRAREDLDWPASSFCSARVTISELVVVNTYQNEFMCGSGLI